jgi:hypothetical protein
MAGISMRAAIRTWLAAQDGPRWGCEIIAGLGAQGITVKLTHIGAMTSDGQLIQCLQKPGDPFSYSLGKIPAKRQAITEEERKAADRARWQRAENKKRDARIAAGLPVRTRGRPKAQQPIVSKFAIATKLAEPVPVQCQTVQEYIASGGVIQRLPGFEQTQGYLPRRPSIGPIGVAP